MMIFLSLRVTADAEGGLKNRAHLRPVLQGFGGGQPPTSTRWVYTGALLATFRLLGGPHSGAQAVTLRTHYHCGVRESLRLADVRLTHSSNFS